MTHQSVKTIENTDVKNPGIVRLLFNDPRMAPFWLVFRVLVGWQWLSIAIPKLSDPGWMESGAVVRGFWEFSVAIPEAGRPPIFYDWYRDFLQGMLDAGAYTWMAKVLVISELAMGVMFILGAFIAVAGIGASFLHVNYLLAGSAGQNAILFPAAILLVAAWKIAGYYGLDYFFMRRVSLLWSPRATGLPEMQSPSTA